MPGRNLLFFRGGGSGTAEADGPLSRGALAFDVEAVAVEAGGRRLGTAPLRRLAEELSGS